MSTTTIAGMTLATANKITGAAIWAIEDSDGNSRRATGAQIRTQMFAGGTGYTPADPLVCGTLDASGAATLKATSSVFRSNRVAGVSCPTGTPTTVLDISTFAGTTGDTLLVWATDGNTGRVASCEVVRDSGTPTWRIFTKDQGATWAGTFTMSGNNLRFTQGTGGTTSVDFIFLKVPGN